MAYLSYDGIRKDKLGGLGALAKIALHIVFDTNSIYAGEGSAEKLLSLPASKLMRLFVSNASLEVHWCLPPMVKSEREYQMTNEALRLIETARKAARFMGRPLEATDDDARKQVQHIIERQIREHGIEEIDFDASLVHWPDLIRRAVQRQPPFETKTEKGFRDAVILETFFQMQKKLSLSPPNQLVLLSSDKLLKTAAQGALENAPEVHFFDRIATLETHLVALSQQINELEAQQVVLIARRFLLESVTVGTLQRMIFDRFNRELRTTPPDGGVIEGWNLVPSETALTARQNSQWMFETSILVEALASRTIQNVPSIRDELNFGSSVFSTSLSTETHPVSVETTMMPISTGFSSITPSTSSTLVYSVGPRVVQSVGRHSIVLAWSATLSEDNKSLSNFAEHNVKYEGVVWQ
jgi:hypothetical protein